MSKAILILDKIPADCGHCRLAMYRNLEIFCAANGERGRENERPDWCPLRKMPERKETNDTMVIMHDAEAANRSTLQQIGYNRGWNDCLDRLEGEHEQPETVG